MHSSPQHAGYPIPMTMWRRARRPLNDIENGVKKASLYESDKSSGRRRKNDNWQTGVGRSLRHSAGRQACLEGIYQALALYVLDCLCLVAGGGRAAGGQTAEKCCCCNNDFSSIPGMAWYQCGGHGSSLDPGSGMANHKNNQQWHQASAEMTPVVRQLKAGDFGWHGCVCVA